MMMNSKPKRGQPRSYRSGDGVVHRYCSAGAKCKHPQGPNPPQDQFYASGVTSDGFDNYCKACRADRRGTQYDPTAPIAHRTRVTNTRKIVGGVTVRECASGDSCVNPRQPEIPLSEFSANARSKDGLSYKCRLCQAHDREKTGTVKNSRLLLTQRASVVRPSVAASSFSSGVGIDDVPALPDHDFYSFRKGKSWRLSTVATWAGIPYKSLLADSRYKGHIFEYESQVVVGEDTIKLIWLNEQRDRTYQSQLASRRETAIEQKLASAPIETPAIPDAPPASPEFRFNAAIRGLRRLFHAMIGGNVIFKDERIASDLMKDINDAQALDQSSSSHN